MLPLKEETCVLFEITGIRNRNECISGKVLRHKAIFNQVVCLIDGNGS